MTLLNITDLNYHKDLRSIRARHKMNPQIFEYKYQCVRDLAWVIASPPLIMNTLYLIDPKFLNKQFFDSEYEKFIPLFNQLDDNPTPLLDHIESRNTRLLGKYFECLVEFWLINNQDKELLAANLQVEENKSTIGEIDFIYRCKVTDKLIHLETAGKFYISHENKSAWNNFIGPNTNDNLGRKLNKLLTDQITITQNGSTKKLLDKIGINENVIPALLFKGYIFYHADSLLNKKFIMPENAEPSHHKGWWIKQSEKEKFFNGNKQWLVLERAKWISPVYGNDYGDTLTSDKLIEKLNKYFSANSYPLIIVEIEKDNKLLIEKSRGFVVPEVWPH